MWGAPGGALASSPANSNEENADQPALLVAIDDRPSRGDLSQPTAAASAAAGAIGPDGRSDSPAAEFMSSVAVAEAEGEEAAHDFFVVQHFNIWIAAIDNGLAFPYKHPDSWRACMQINTLESEYFT